MTPIAGKNPWNPDHVEAKPMVGREAQFIGYHESPNPLGEGAPAVSPFRVGDSVVIDGPPALDTLPHIQRLIQEGRAARVVEVDENAEGVVQSVTVEWPIEAEHYHLESFATYDPSVLTLAEHRC